MKTTVYKKLKNRAKRYFQNILTRPIHRFDDMVEVGGSDYRVQAIKFDGWEYMYKLDNSWLSEEEIEQSNREEE